MERTVLSVFIAVGVLLVLLCLTEAVASEISSFIKGNPIDASVGLMVTGSVVSFSGITDYVRNRQRDFFYK